MAASSPPKPKPRRRPTWQEMDTKNRAGMGWQIEDFGSVVSQQQMTPGLTQPSAPLPSGSGITGLGQLPSNSLTSQLPTTTKASQVLTPAEQQRVRTFINNPKELGVVSGQSNSVVSFLSNLFDTEDTPVNPLDKGGFLESGINPFELLKRVPEYFFDNSLKALSWPVDQVNHLSAAAISAMPGGMQTLDWSQANQMSTGQALISDLGIRAGKIRRGEANLGDIVSGGAFTALGFLSPDSPVQKPGFNPLTPEGKKAFEEGPEKFFSGVTDFGMAFADPLIVGGKLGKLSRIKYIDRLVVTDEQRAGLIEDLASVYRAPEGKAAPIAETLKQWTKIDPETGQKVVSRDEIFNHPVIKRAANRDALADALYNARDVTVTDVLNPAMSKTMNGYDLGSLILRWAYNDTAAARELGMIRADMADALALADRNRIALMHALNPDVAERSIKVAENAFTKAEDKIRELERMGMRNTPDWDAAVKARDIAQQTMTDLHNGNFDILQHATPDAEALAARVFKALVDNNTALKAAIGRDVTTDLEGVRGALMESTRGFAKDSRIGRAVEARRRSKARIEYEMSANRRAYRLSDEMVSRGRQNGSRAQRATRQHMWQEDVFGNGFTRNVSIWRRASMEAPAPFIITKGIGAQESTRQVRAMVNDVRIYSGKPRKIILDDGRTIEVGGVARKDQLIGMYQDALAAGTDDAVAHALTRVEQAIFNDISAWHGIHRDNAKILLRDAFRERAKLMDGLTDEKRGFWIDDSGKFNVIKDPWLDSHISNGRFVLNYREFERLASRVEKSDLGRLLGDGAAWAGRGVSTLTGLFNQIWRPLVLLRLGYTSRNVLEGQFRAWAFTGSLDPFSNAVVNAGYSAKSLFGKLSGYRNIDRAAAETRIASAKAGGRQLPKKFEPWLRQQINGGMRQANDHQAYIATQLPMLAEFSPEIRKWGLDWYSRTLSRLSSDLYTARAAGKTDEADAITQTMNDMIKQMDQVDKTFAFQKFNRDAVNAFDNLKATDFALNDIYSRLDRLNDTPTALSQFYRQGAARARASSGTIQGPDSKTIYEALNPENPFTPVALSLLSSDGTFRSLLSGRTEGSRSAIRAQMVSMYEAVQPGDPGYWDGVATALSQIRFSGLGSRIMKGQTDNEIIDFLLNDREGIEILRFLNGMSAQDITVGARQVRVGRGATPSRDVAGFFVRQARERYDKLTPTQEFRAYVESLPPGVEYDAKALKAAYNGSNDQLAPVIGSHITDFGIKKPMELWKQATGFGMRWLGTIPEDTFVRSPFYGARYQRTVQELVRTTMQQEGTISMRDVDSIMRLAHRRALKDTKDWLYTIDRPTLLGRVGETSVPFISAAQNSMTTFGRLIYNDPSVAVVLSDLWRAPGKAGFEDEEGNIVIPIPHEWIPDGVEKFLGIDAMRNWKINKSQLNVIVPESGFGFIPRPGPILAVPASEIMKKGWLDFTVESPPLLRTVLGGKDNADAVWNVFKNYIYGEGQGVAPDAGSLSMFLPPVAQKIQQILMKENSPQFGYWYNTIMRSEWAKWSAGMRDTVPTKDEIMNQTVGFQILRLAANLTAVTPPTYESVIDPMIQTVRYYERTDPNNSNRIINEKFGPILQMLGDFSNSQNNAGMLPTADSVERARKYSDVIAEVAPGLEERGDLSVLTMIAMGNANQLYDDSAYGWQFANTIPGINRSFREMQKPEQSWVQSDVNAGWATYLRAEDQFKARLRQSGKTSYRSNPQLQAERNQYIADLASNPMFENWYRDYKDFGSSRTRSSIYVMETLVNNQRFMNDNADSDIWQIAPLYLYHRNAVLQTLAQRGNKGIDSDGNEDVRAYWDQVRADLEASSTQWSSFTSRFLNGDDDPEEPGVTFSGQTMTR